MPVRGTSRWTHARIDRAVINLDHMEGKHVYCAWDTCTNDGYESNKVVEVISAPGYPRETLTYVFCSERHRQYFIDQTKPGLYAGKLAPGNRRMLT